jgi:hypothetical protein
MAVSLLRVWIDDPAGDGGGGGFSDPASSDTPPYDRISGAEISQAELVGGLGGYLPGMLVSSATSTNGDTSIMRSAGRYDSNLYGAVSTSAFNVLGQESSTTLRVGLTGRMPVIVSLENGPIHQGDRIAASSLSGVGMKASRPSMVLGRALQNFDAATTTASTTLAQVVCDAGLKDELLSSGISVAPNACLARIMVALEKGSDFTIGDMIQDSVLAPFADLTSALAELSNTAFGKGAELVKIVAGELIAKVAVIGDLFADKITATVITADKVNAKTLCLDGLCVTKTQLQQLLDNAGTSGAGGGLSGGDTGTTTGSGDTEAPVITLNGNNPATVNVGTTYTDLGASVSDNVDHNLGFTVSLDGGPAVDISQLSIDTSTSTTYTILFSAIDAAGNTGTATRQLEVVAP